MYMWAACYGLYYTLQRNGLELNPGPADLESSALTTTLTSHTGETAKFKALPDASARYFEGDLHS